MSGTDVTRAMQASKRPDNEMEDFFLNGIMMATFVLVSAMLPQTTEVSGAGPVNTRRL